MLYMHYTIGDFARINIRRGTDCFYDFVQYPIEKLSFLKPVCS